MKTCTVSRNLRHRCNRHNSAARTIRRPSSLTEACTVDFLTRCRVTHRRLIRSKKNTTRKTRILNSRISVSTRKMRRMSCKPTDLITMSNRQKARRKLLVAEPRMFPNSHHRREATPTPKTKRMTHLRAPSEINLAKMFKILESRRLIRECGIILNRELKF